ncbi:MAG: ComF family protein [Sedimenticola sp.]|nr:ComF family protein [Sedimenticola sp.]
MVNNCINIILDALFPSHCPLCLTPSSDVLCPGCMDDLPINRHCCRRCAMPITDPHSALCGHCLQAPPIIDCSRIPFRYADPIDQMIGQYKFSANLANGRILSQLWLGHQQTPVELPELLIPIPLHPERLCRRGFNQALELARPLGRHFGIAVDHKSCERVLNTPPQAGLKRQQRKQNLRGSFRLKQRLKVEHVALVDDVVTTGSTVFELARLLKKSGIRRVDVWALARTP